MLKVLGAQIKEFKKDALITPVFMILEVIMEMIIPLLMASIIDDGVNAGNLNHIYKIGFIMIVMALIGLWAGLMGAKYGAKASTGFARNLRKAMFENAQKYKEQLIKNKGNYTPEEYASKMQGLANRMSAFNARNVADKKELNTVKNEYNSAMRDDKKNFNPNPTPAK